MTNRFHFTVREFSPAGPCIVLGDLVRETPRFYTYSDRSNGKLRKIAKRTTERYSAAHVDPCPSCRDRTKTHYPDGYMD
jgi:hypothetical protein